MNPDSTWSGNGVIAELILARELTGFATYQDLSTTSLYFGHRGNAFQ